MTTAFALLQAQTNPAAAALQGIPNWALWSAGIVGLGLMVFSAIRNAKRVARQEEDLPISEPQRRWAARAKEPKGARGADDAPGAATDPRLAAASAALLAQLDDRADRLEQLIAQADARLAELRRLTSVGAAGSTRGTAEPKTGASVPRSPLAPAPAGGSSRTAQVYRLADEGLTPQEIAETTGAAIGEVNLVLALRS